MTRPVDSKPGQAAADRVREKLEAGRDKREDALDKAFDPDRDLTPAHPVVVIRKGETGSMSTFPMPKKLKPYIIGGVIALALTGAGVQTDMLLDFVKLLFGAP